MADGTPNAAHMPAPALPSPMECELVDEHGQTHLLIDDGGPAGAHPLILRMTNRSGHELEWLAADDKRAQPVAAGGVFHHLRLSFRPGVLSEAAQKALEAEPGLVAQKQPSQVVASSDWQVVKAGEDGEHDFVVDLLYVGTERGFPVGVARQLTLRGLFGRGGPSRLTRVAVTFAQLGEKGAKEVSALFPSQRRCQLYLLHGGRRDAPLRIGFAGTDTIRADGRPADLTLMLHNAGKQTIGAVAAALPPVRLRLTIENDDSPWALWHGKQAQQPGQPTAWWVLRRPKIKVEPLAGMGVHEIAQVEGRELASGHGDNFLSWSHELDRSGIAAGESIEIDLRQLLAYREGTTNLYVDLFNVPGFADSRTTLTITRANWSADLEKAATGLDGRINDAERKITGHQSLLQKLPITNVEGLQPNLQSVRADLDALRGRTSALESLRNTIEADIGSLKQPKRDKLLHIYHLQPGKRFATNREFHMPIKVGEAGNLIEVTMSCSVSGATYYDIKCDQDAQALGPAHGVSSSPGWQSVSLVALFCAKRTDVHKITIIFTQGDLGPGGTIDYLLVIGKVLSPESHLAV